MQTIYYTTNQFISHRDNIVDLEEYRRGMNMAQEGSLAPQPKNDNVDVADLHRGIAGEQPELMLIRPPCSRKLRRRAFLLDICASLSVVIMTLFFTLWVLFA